MTASVSVVQPRHRTIFGLDVEGSTSKTNMGRAQLRNTMYDLLEEALLLVGISERYRDVVDRGDGVLVLVQPVDDLPKTTVLNVLTTLGELLRGLESDRPEHSVRMRAAVHAGEVHYDKRGVYGEDVDITCRLLDAPELKQRLKKTPEPLVLAVSQHMYLSVIRHGYEGIDSDAFKPLVQLQIGGIPQCGWVRVGEASTQHQLAG